ncbi:DUF202 domain-containing protein [Actinorugispora endophytica]|uniref:Uncharacterized protein DUF202 n=1 Tax=Actinorugispora endophytica TaxID=1605990 RepID=A0A4R6VE44_9ACTN|nr:DUF202 domain-containing protein [Actinorugispora endophytica]TDQ55307.1 uncharacterized protein DUF202 [Actinorugispora endophytica]
MSARPPRDRGLQPERTLLSWQRTVFLLVVVVLLYLRVPLGESAEGPAADMAGRVLTVLGVLGAVIVLIVHLRRRWRRTDHGLHDDDTGTPPAPLARPWALVLLGAAVALLGTAVAATAVPTP